MLTRCSPKPSLSLQQTQAKGFTLLEIMLVLLVISVAVGLAVIVFANNPARELEREAKRLQALLNQASEEAVVQGVELGLAVSNSQPGYSYQLLVLDGESMRWVLPAALNLEGFEAEVYAMPEKINWELTLEGGELGETQPYESQLYKAQQQQMAQVLGLSSPNALRPVLLILSSGELTPFRLQLTHPSVALSQQLYSDGISGVYRQ